MSLSCIAEPLTPPPPTLPPTPTHTSSDGFHMAPALLLLLLLLLLLYTTLPPFPPACRPTYDRQVGCCVLHVLCQQLPRASHGSCGPLRPRHSILLRQPLVLLGGKVLAAEELLALWGVTG
jgi:hypothetical protein